MPANVVKNKSDEKAWNDIKKSVEKQYPGLKQKNPTRYWSLVNGIFQKQKKKSAASENEERWMDNYLKFEWGV